MWKTGKGKRIDAKGMKRDKRGRDTEGKGTGRNREESGAVTR